MPKVNDKSQASGCIGVIVGLLLLVGLYFPTDVVTDHVTILHLMAYLICVLLIAVLGLRKGGLARFPACVGILSIVPLLVFFTYTSEHSAVRLGGLIGYVVLSLLLIINVRDITVLGWLDTLWLIVNIVNIAAGIAIVVGWPTLSDFIVAHYSMATDDLVLNMLTSHMPVLTFGSHSIAAFFLFLFFWTNLETYKIKRKAVYLLLGVCYLFLVFAQISVSGLVLGCVGLMLLAGYTWQRLPHKWLAISLLTASLFATALWAKDIGVADYSDAAVEIFTNPGAGYFGRYLPGGTMYADIEYLREHPFRPIGASFRGDFMVGDSGIVEYLLRGSLPLLILVYGGLLVFLRRNVIFSTHAHFLFAVIVAFEIGYTTLTNFRTLCLLPFLAVYLNSLKCSEANAR